MCNYTTILNGLHAKPKVRVKNNKNMIFEKINILLKLHNYNSSKNFDIEEAWGIFGKLEYTIKIKFYNEEQADFLNRILAFNDINLVNHDRYALYLSDEIEEEFLQKLDSLVKIVSSLGLTQHSQHLKDDWNDEVDYLPLQF